MYLFIRFKHLRYSADYILYHWDLSQSALIVYYEIFMIAILPFHIGNDKIKHQKLFQTENT